MDEHNDIRILFHPRICLTSPYLPHQRWQVRISFGPKRFKTRIGSKVQSQAGMPVSLSSVFLLKRSVSNAQRRKGCGAEGISDRSVSIAYRIQSTVTGRNACVTFVCLLIETERFKRTTSQRARGRKHFGPKRFKRVSDTKRSHRQECLYLLVFVISLSHQPGGRFFHPRIYFIIDGRPGFSRKFHCKYRCFTRNWAVDFDRIRYSSCRHVSRHSIGI